jgi:predicted secreted acid phosphatase
MNLRKKYAVNFDFDETLINDTVYALNETTPFYVFGRGRDVVKVC